MRYVWPGKLSLQFPDGWHLSEPGDLIEVTPPDESGAAHISVFHRTEPGLPSTADARALVGWFAKRRGCGSVEVDSFQHEGVAEGGALFESVEDGIRTAWYVRAKVWTREAILASYCTAPGRAAHLPEFLAMVESAQPDHEDDRQ